MKVKPSLQRVASDCPHCGAFTSQAWFHLFTERYAGDNKTPELISGDLLKDIELDETLNCESKARLTTFLTKEQSGMVFLEMITSASYSRTAVHNLYLSQCFACSAISVWVHDKIVFPSAMEAELPNADLPEDIRVDYMEASRIISLSPRGAAALLRLAIQKLCVFLGEKGKSIDDDIASLVKKGLLPIVQQSLDSLRVIGNEAVHPGTMNLKDGQETASQLFKLVNIIAEQMISSPKQAQELYERLPQNKKAAINKRDGKPPNQP